jgi:hypothetical protein
MTAPAGARGPAPEPDSPRAEAVLKQLEVLLASPYLRESHQLQAFLDFVVKETLAGRQDGLKEYTLGCQVFGRRGDYDPRHDGIVRVQATTLRKRLEKHYSAEGASDAVVIELPRGGYVPSFHSIRTAVAVPAPMVWPSWRVAAVGVAAGMFIMGIAWLSWQRLQPPPPYHMTAARPSDFPALWSAFFVPGTQTLVGCGVPLFYNASGLYVRDVYVNTPDQADRGRINEFAAKLNLRPSPTDDTYTGVGEMVGTNQISSFLTTHGVAVHIANARTLGSSVLANHNLIIISSMRFQTLLDTMKLPSAFRFDGLHGERILNLMPHAGEPDVYHFRDGAGTSTSYALVSLWPGLTAGKRILCIGGFQTWATQAATDFVLQPDQLRAMARRLAADRDNGPHGKPSPYFQILLKVEGRQNQPREVEYVTHRYLAADARPES